MRAGGRGHPVGRSCAAEEEWSLEEIFSVIIPTETELGHQDRKGSSSIRFIPQYVIYSSKAALSSLVATRHRELFKLKCK